MPWLVFSDQAIKEPGFTSSRRVSEDNYINVYDHAGDHSASAGRGVWVHAFLGFLVELVTEEYGRSRLSVSDTIDHDRIGPYLPNDEFRPLLIRFINHKYHQWVREHVHVLEYKVAATKLRRLCEGCPTGWTYPLDKYGNRMLDEMSMFTCARDCAPYTQKVGELISSGVRCDMNALREMWEEFKRDVGVLALPAIKPETGLRLEHSPSPY